MAYWLLALPPEDMRHCIKLGVFGRKNKKNISQLKKGDKLVLYESSYELKFLNGNDFGLRQTTIHTDGCAITCIPLFQPVSEEMLNFICSKWRNWFGFPKFFRLEYTALVGDSKYNVSCCF